jgi:hypothetical protein
LTCAETAALVRQALREAFPGVRFAVRSKTYAGGASINVGWTDGPTANAVKGIVGRFEGAYFDGMTDYKGALFNQLDGEEVRFGADYIFTNRALTIEVLTDCINAVRLQYGLDAEIEVIRGEYDNYVGNMTIAEETVARGFDEYTIRRLIGEQIARTGMVEPAPCATANRVVNLGDDGYGYGRTGRRAA